MVADDVDVIIPAYNAATTIRDAVASVLGQTVRPRRVIVVDDGSTDATAAEAAAAGGGRVEVVAQRNGGQGSARRRGATLSTATTLLFLDADDLLDPDALRRLRQALADRPGSPAAYCGTRLVCEGGPLPPEFPVDLPDCDGDAWRTLVCQNVIRTPGCVLIRRAALDAVGGWDPSRSLQGNEDWDLWLRLAEVGPFVRVEGELLTYRVHTGGFSRGRLPMYRSHLRVMLKYAARCARDPERGPVLTSLWVPQRVQLSRDGWGRVRAAAKAKRWAEAGGWAMFAARCWPRSLGWPVRRRRR